MVVKGAEHEDTPEELGFTWVGEREAEWDLTCPTLRLQWGSVLLQEHAEGIMGIREMHPVG